MFLRPTTTKVKHKTKTKDKKKKHEQWTDKQRKTWAQAHHIYHHGTAADAAKFLSIKSNARNIPGDWKAMLEQKREEGQKP